MLIIKMVKARAAVVPLATDNLSLLLKIADNSAVAAPLECSPNSLHLRMAKNNKSPAQEMPIRNMCLSINRLL